MVGMVQSLMNPHPSQLGFAYGKHLGATPSPFLVLRTEGGRKLADAEGRPTASLRGSRFLD
jgi:hypothetical protein